MNRKIRNLLYEKDVLGVDVNSNQLVNFFEPIELSLKKGYIRDADIFSLINMYFLNSSGVVLKFIFVIFIFLINYFHCFHYFATT